MAVLHDVGRGAVVERAGILEAVAGRDIPYRCEFGFQHIQINADAAVGEFAEIGGELGVLAEFFDDFLSGVREV